MPSSLGNRERAESTHCPADPRPAPLGAPACLYPNCPSTPTSSLSVPAPPASRSAPRSLRAACGVRTTLIDRQAEGDNTSRAAVVHARTLEVLEPLGDVTPTLVARGLPVQRFTLRDRDRVLVPIGFENLPTRYPFTLMISQADTERVLLERLRALGGRVLRPRTLVSLAQDETSATATLDDGQRLRARYVVGAGGMHSAVRESAGIAFVGNPYAESFSLADVRLTGGVPQGEVILYFSPAGMAVVAPLPGGVHRIVATVDEAPEQPDIAFVQALLDARRPQREPVQVREVLWGSRFRVQRVRNALLATVAKAQRVRSRLAWQLSGLVYR